MTLRNASTYNHSQGAIEAKCAGLGNDFTAFTKDDIEQSISNRFEEQVAKYPDRLAVKAKDGLFTYDSLNKTANRVARAILAQCDDGKETVALLFEQGAPVIVAMIGVLKAGKIDVPLDPVNPVARIGDMLEDSRASLIVTNNQYLSLARELAENKLKVLNIDDLDESLSAANLGLIIPPDAPARIIYTSGSTGRPKGALQNHRRILHEVMTNINGCYVGAADRVSLLASPSTSQGTVITYTALLSGASLCLFNLRTEGLARLADWLDAEQITVYTSVRAIFRLFASALCEGQEFPYLRLIALGGDQVRKGDVELYKKRFSDDCILKIFLSSTETGNLCQYEIHKETAIANEIVPVGYPTDGMEILLLDEQGKEVGFDEVGDIAVKSRYLSLGYWQQPDLTATKFLPDPDGGDKRIYLTGDLGRRRPDGCLEYFGRKDLRVKISGYGVEIGEIESALLKDDRVRETVVVTMEEPDKDALLIAYVVPAQQPGPTPNELRSFLTKKLPDHMVPSQFVVLDDLPLTPMGKIDRQALPPLDHTALGSETTFVAPRTPLETKLAALWGEVLGLERVGIHDTFFDLGGNSLSAIEVISRVRATFQADIQFGDLIARPTLAEMAAAVVQRQVDRAEPRELSEVLSDLEELSEEEAQRLLVEQTHKGKV